MATVDQDREAYRAGTPVVDERIHRSADRAAGEENIVDKHDDAAVDGERDLRLAYHRRVPDTRQVVAVERDIDRAQRDQGAFVGADGGLDAWVERGPARANGEDGASGEI